MDTLPHSVLLHILSRLNDSADVARCRVASKAFNTVFPGLRSIHLRCSLEWYNSYSRVSIFSSSQRIKPFKAVLLDLTSKLETVESVSIRFQSSYFRERDDFGLTDGDFAEWLPRVSGSLKSLTISDHRTESRSNVLVLISTYCYNLVNLKLKLVWLSLHNLNPMLMLTNLTLSFVTLGDEHLNQLNKCFPNLQVLKLANVSGVEHAKIHLFNLKTFVWNVYDELRSLTLITPNLITLKFESINLVALHIQAPMLSHLQLSLNGRENATALTVKKFQNLKTLWLDSAYIGFVLSEFLITKTVESLTLYSAYGAPRDSRDSEFTLGKVFTVFPNVSSLCIKSEPWSELESWLDPGVLEILDGGKGLKTLCIYLELPDPLLTFSSVAYVLDQCLGLSEVSLLIKMDVLCTVAESFMSKCMARWPGLKWRWGFWSEGLEDWWIDDDVSS